MRWEELYRSCTHLARPRRGGPGWSDSQHWFHQELIDAEQVLIDAGRSQSAVLKLIRLSKIAHHYRSKPRVGVPVPARIAPA